MKKSARLIMQSYQIELRRKARYKYNWPRTVEFAVDPYDNPTGKNKMFYAIAINLFPESKIVVPSDTEESESEYEMDEAVEAEVDLEGGSSSTEGVDDKVQHHPGRVRKNSNSRNGSRRSRDEDISWRSQYNRQMLKHLRQRERRQRQGRPRIVDTEVIQDVIQTVIAKYSLRVYQEDKYNPTKLIEDFQTNSVAPNPS